MNEKTRIHFIGIGGISMSGLAEIALKNGFHVTGSDRNHSNLIEKLRLHGAVINIPHDASAVVGADLVVYTAAVKRDNPEMQRAFELDLPILERSSYLGSIMKNYKYGIAIAGTHGKTTTTSMAGIVFKEAGFDPTILVGGEVPNIGGNVLSGESQYFITEACEYVESFLEFFPKIGVILNIELDHLDYFRDLDHIKNSFLKFAELIPDDGTLIVSADNANSIEVGLSSGRNLITFGVKHHADLMAKKLSFDESGFGNFDLEFKGQHICHIKLSVPGEHNVENALAVMAISITAGISPEKASSSLTNFRGTDRRFEFIEKINGIQVIDDYAHHPTEIKATLSAAKNIPHKKTWVVFQPHTYTRTKTLFDDFTTCFTDADVVFITDVYAAREVDPGDVDLSALADGISATGVMCDYCSDFEVISDIIAAGAKDGDLVFTMGAGDIFELAPMILDKITQVNSKNPTHK